MKSEKLKVKNNFSLLTLSSSLLYYPLIKDKNHKKTPKSIDFITKILYTPSPNKNPS